MQSSGKSWSLLGDAVDALMLAAGAGNLLNFLLQ